MQDYIHAAPKYRRRRSSPWPLLALVLLLTLIMVARITIQRDISNLSRYYEDIIWSQESHIEYLEIRIQQLERELEDHISLINTLLDEQEAMREVLQWDTRQMTITHYAPLDPGAIEGVCYSGDPTITASGTTVEPGVTVAAGRNIPFGTRVYIPGYGFREVQDRGGAIGPNSIDIAVSSRDRAFELGRISGTVYVEVDH